MIHNAFTPLHLWLYARRRGVLLLTLLLAMAGLLVTARIELEEDILAMLPQRDQRVDQFQYALKKFRQIDRLYFDVSVTTEDTAQVFQAADALHAVLSQRPELSRVLYRVEATDQRKLFEYITGALPVLFTEADQEALAAKLQPENVRAYLGTMRRKLAGPEGLVLAPLVAADPIGLSALTSSRLIPLQAGFSGAHLEEGRIVSANNRHVLLMAEPRFASSDSGRSRRMVPELLAEIATLEQQFPGVRIAMTGGHRMSVDNARLIERDAIRCTLIGMGAMGLLCFLAYRRRWLALLTFVPSLLGTLAAGVVLALCYDQVSAIAIGFASIAIGVTVDYAIYVVYHLDNAAGLHRRGVGDHLSRLVLPITAGALTSVAAFAVMALSPMRGYQQLGLFGAIGVLVSAALGLLVLPLFIPVPKQTSQPPLWLTRWLDRFFAWRQRRLAWLLVSVVLISILAAFGLSRLRFEGDMSRLNGVTPATQAAEETLRATWGDAMGLTLVLSRGATLEQALARNDQAATVLAAQSAVKSVYSLASVMPSQATQQANYQRWRTFWTTERKAALEQTLRQVGAELGFRPGAFAAFWTRLEQDPVWVSLETFQDTPVAQAITERLAIGEGDTAVSTLVKLADRDQAVQLQAALPAAYVLDRQAFTRHIAELARTELVWFALLTALLVAVLLYFSYSSLKLVIATLAPLGFGLLWTFGAMGWLGLPIDLMNSVFVVFIIGIGEDYSVFLVTSRLDEWRGHGSRLGATSAAVVISALTTLFGFAVLVLAQHPVLFSLGTTVLLGLVCALIATLVLTLLFTDWVLRLPKPAAAWPAQPSSKTLRQQIQRLYRYQGQWVEQFAIWKMKLDPVFGCLDAVTPRQGLILDLGCGFGMGTHWLALSSPDRQVLGLDYDPDKIRVARQSARGQARVEFAQANLLDWEFPACDAILFVDVLHYWTADKQWHLLRKARAALRPGGRLILREAARAQTEAHRRVEWWERLVTRLGHNKTLEGLHFQSADSLKTMLATAGFAEIREHPNAGRDSNLMLLATTTA